MRTSLTEQERRSRRRQRRIQVVIIYTAIAICLAWFFESQATTTLIFVRHAEKTAEPGDDPGLSVAGQRRAVELARQLSEADVIAGVDAIYATTFERSQATAKPLAMALDLPINTYDAGDNETVLGTILDEHKGEIVLVVAHSNTLPALIANLGASKRVPPISEDEYDNIYVISIPWFGKTKTIRLRYGEAYQPEAESL